MGHESDDEARRRRLDALRALASAPAGSGPAPAAPPAAPSPGEVMPFLSPTPPTANTGILADTVVRASKRRRRAGRPLGTSARSPFWLRGALALLAVCVVAGGVLLYLRRTLPPKPLPDPVSILFNSATMGCPQAVAWSPDSSRVAVLGYVACSGPDNSNVGPNGETLGLPNTGGTLLLYNALTGHLDADISLDTATEAVVPTSVRADPSVMRYVGINYDQLIWSPNGRQLAIRFSASSNSLQNGQYVAANYGQGLLLVTAASHDIKLLSQPAVPQINYPASSFDSVPIIHWDLTAGTSSYTSLPQALAYQWNADGTLAPSIALPATSTAPAPQVPRSVNGNPDGGKEFAAWQSGYANFGEDCTAQSDPTTAPTCCPITTYLTGGFFVFGDAWSPDGRYLVIPYGLGIGAMGKFPAPAGIPAPPSLPGCPLPGQESPTNLVNLPARDAAMTAVMKALVPTVVYTQNGPSGPASGSSSAQFVWSPNGKRVVVSEQNNGPQLPDTPIFSLYDTATGAQSASFSTSRLVALGHLPTNELYKGQSLSFSAMLWSPNSQRLLLLDTNEHAMLLLGAKTLKG